MTVQHLQLWLAWLFVYAGPPLSWASVILHARTPWRASEMGRHLFYYALILAIIFSFSAAKFFTKDHPWPYWLEVVHLSTYAVLILGIMPWRVWLQVKSARRR